MAKCAFLGLGVMGYRWRAIWRRPVTGDGLQPQRAKADKWVAEHGGSAPHPRQAAEGADFVMACVGVATTCRSVCLGADGAFAGMAESAIFVITPRSVRW